ncbi:hypothetical protein SAMN05421644_11820 [Allochromatium warmingii]|uniref:DUF6997 domain-containing protein n=1 Tax=Allochromatium warmingii TaxID=61595 RepID=A0A1H3FEC9_ALLWA|nr:hypothetical protein [Allochromatium warmingii]SDX89372.1 hypothetical protein SAMN05421644_11820 [Allochromatium warmingii]
MPTFSQALVNQPKSGFWLYGPEVFRTYCRRNGLHADTASTISVDHIRTLSKELREAETMILRLGTGHGNDGVRGQTAFALVRHEECSLAPFFLIDEQIFTDPPETFIPNRSMRVLFPFGLLPKLSETSLLTLAHASGLMTEALDCDDSSIHMIPATGAGTYSFSFTVGSDQPHHLEHIAGQVEIDSVCIGVRNGRNYVIVTEAKRGPFDSIAKHKLAYAVWAVRTNIPDDIPILAVYLRVTDTNQGLEFNIAECAIDDGRSGVPSLHSIKPIRHRRLRIRNPCG